MSGSILEIHRLAQNGETLRRIRCLPGRVTVFRSHKDEELELYKNVICGSAGEERFALLVDEVPFKRQNHTLVGLSEVSELDPDMTVSAFLEAAKARPETLESLLLRLGLGGSLERRLGNLSSGEQETLQVIAATFSPEKILILHNPFEQVGERWRERLAQLVADFAAKKNATVLVTKLSYRPQCWIENEYIARVQLERARQATIGYGGDASADTSELIRKIRSEIQSEMKSEVATFAPLRHVQATEEEDPRTASNASVHGGVKAAFKGRLIPISAALAGAIVLALVILLNQPPVIQPSGISNKALQETNSQGSGVTVPAVNVNAQGGEKSVAVQVKKSQPLLDNYPQTIRDGVRLAFLDPSRLLGGAAGAQVSGNLEKPKLETLMRALMENQAKNSSERQGF